MKKLVPLVIAITITAANSASGQSAKQKAAIEQEIRKLDLAHADAVLRGDQVTLDELGLKISESTIHLMK